MGKTQRYSGKKGGRLTRTMRGGGGYNIFLADDEQNIERYANVRTGNIFGSANIMSGKKVQDRISGKIVQTLKDGVQSLNIYNVKTISRPPALKDAEATQYYSATITTTSGMRQAVIARYKDKNDASRKYNTFQGIITLGRETGFLSAFARTGPEQVRNNLWTSDSSLPSTPRGTDDRVDFGGDYYDGYSGRGVSKNKRKSLKKKNPHKKKKGSKHVKSKNKPKTRKNIRGGGKAYYIVKNRQGENTAEGFSDSKSRFLPNRFNAPSIPNLEKKIINDVKSREQKRLKDIIDAAGGIVSVEHYGGSTTWTLYNGSTITRYDSSPITNPPIEGMKGNVPNDI